MKSLLLFLLLAEFGIIGGYLFYTRFTNIDMTETRLFFTYWKQYALIASVYIVTVFAYYGVKSK
jgi:uncharacterized membrane protein YobD (UPF0266 family)